jgi:hypothetical protein
LFTAENRWGYFPAVGLAWKLKEENFLKDSKVSSRFKIESWLG